MKRFAMFVGLILLASVAYAGPCHQPKPCNDCETVLRNINPDLRPNLELLVGFGNANTDNDANGDINTLGAALTIPTNEDMSVVAKWDHYNLEWDGGSHYGYQEVLPDFQSDVFSFGLKLYLP